MKLTLISNQENGIVLGEENVTTAKRQRAKGGPPEDNFLEVVNKQNN